VASAQTSRFLTLLQREFREYRNSLFWTPVITALVLGVLMIGSVVLVNSVSIIGDTILEALMAEGGTGVNVTISLNEDTGEEVTVVEVTGIDETSDIPDGLESEVARIELLEDADREVQRVIIQNPEGGAYPLPEPPAPPSEYEVLIDEDGEEEQWNFSREWNFNPDPANGGGGETSHEDMDGRELNAMLGVIHGILILILLVTSANYLLGSLYDDRKDRSILFWRSMPVSEWEVVSSKFVIALIVAPLIYIAISLVLQLAYVVLMMVLVWRMDQDPSDVVLANIDFVALMLDPISGWVMTALLIAPTYAWLLCASALAKRSPFLMAITPFIALVIAEAVFFRSEYIEDAIQNHFPHVTEGSAVGFYLFGPDWTSLNLSSMAAGLIFAALALAVAVWLRRHRWELN